MATMLYDDIILRYVMFDIPHNIRSYLITLYSVMLQFTVLPYGFE